MFVFSVSVWATLMPIVAFYDYVTFQIFIVRLRRRTGKDGHRFHNLKYLPVVAPNNILKSETRDVKMIASRRVNIFSSKRRILSGQSVNLEIGHAHLGRF